MPHPNINYDRVALILVEATYHNDRTVAKNWSISQKTIYNYRKRLANDSGLAELYRLKKSEFERNWGNGVSAAIISALDFIKRASQEADPKNPEAIHAIAGALKLVAEVGLTKEVIDARLAEYHRSKGETNIEVIAALPSRTS